MPLAPIIRRWRILAAVGLLAAAVASPVLAQGQRSSVMYILMGDHYFLPASVTVQPGTTIVFMNQGSSVHSVVSALWNSGPMVPGQAFWRPFNVPGEYWFTDPMYADEGMNGYITVQEGSPVATRTPQPPPPPPPSPTGPPAAPTGGAPPAPPAQPPGPTSVAIGTVVPTGSPGPGGTTTAPAGTTGSPVPAGSPAPARAAGSPAPAGSPMPPMPMSTPRAEGPSDESSTAPGAGSADLPLPESRPAAPDSGASLPLPLLGGGLFLLGLVGTRRRPRR